jgi:DNA-binding MarR family transcriptional regulator
VAEPTRTEPVRDQDRELWGITQQATQAMLRARDAELRPIGITSAQAAILYFVKVIEDPVTPAMLSRWLVREPHTVSAILSRMEKHGLVNRAKDLPRKNIVRVTLTERGRKLTHWQARRRSSAISYPAFLRKNATHSESVRRSCGIEHSRRFYKSRDGSSPRPDLPLNN